VTAEEVAGRRRRAYEREARLAARTMEARRRFYVELRLLYEPNVAVQVRSRDDRRPWWTITARRGDTVARVKVDEAHAVLAPRESAQKIRKAMPL
jgi:hypothetical protein